MVCTSNFNHYIKLKDCRNEFHTFINNICLFRTYGAENTVGGPYEWLLNKQKLDETFDESQTSVDAMLSNIMKIKDYENFFEISVLY